MKLSPFCVGFRVHQIPEWRSPFSLDAPLHDGGELPHEWLAPPVPAANEPLRLDWLSDEILEGVLIEARVDVSQVEYNRIGGNHRCRGKRGNTNSTPNWKRKKKEMSR